MSGPPGSALPRLRRAHPQLKGVKLDTIWRAANHMTPSMIRVEADELTYNLHIILRYEIERDLFNGVLAVRELPERWNEGMRELLGVVPHNDAEGVPRDPRKVIGLYRIIHLVADHMGHIMHQGTYDILLVCYHTLAFCMCTYHMLT